MVALSEVASLGASQGHPKTPVGMNMDDKIAGLTALMGGEAAQANTRRQPVSALSTRHGGEVKVK